MRALQLALLTSVSLMTTPASALSQIVEIRTRPTGVAAASTPPRVELFGRGLLDLHFSGQVEASAQTLKIRIGEPDGFSVPLYLITGATSSTFGASEFNEETLVSLISPTGGFLNAMLNGTLTIVQSATGISRVQVAGLGSGRLHAARPADGGDMSIFGAGYVDGGVLLQTGAWDANGSYEQGGVAWLQAKYNAVLISTNRLQEYFGEDSEQPHGVRIEGGLLIRNRVNVKAGVFIPTAGKQLPTLDKAAVRFALDYNVSR